MEYTNYELKVTQDGDKGKLIEGKILRPEKLKMVAAVDLQTQDFVVALTLIPVDADPVYGEPVVVFLNFQIVESFIKGVLAAQGSIAAETHKGGNA
jgi:hypothetical protein